MQVTLETKCWERDWESLLEPGRLQSLARDNQFEFAERVLMINNVNDYARVCDRAQKAVEQGWITRYVVVRDFAQEALQFFNLSVESLGKGYVYSIAELVSIFLCRTEFLLHFAGDTAPRWPRSWIEQAIGLMNSDSRIKVANLNWDLDFKEARADSEFQTPDFYVGHGFSDQCFLIRTCDYRAPIYNESHVLSGRYPKYGGELFEKRVDSWMRNHGWLRATFKHGSYFHLETPQPLGRRLSKSARRLVGKMLRRVALR
jgi:hypothetical protein